MKQNFRNVSWGRLLSVILTAALLFTSLETPLFVQAAEGDAISIGTAADLRKIGTDSAYPMNGDYKLTADIDLSGSNWEPMGGHLGNKGTCNPAEANVFSGTFDGQGHVISGLTINLNDSINQTNQYGQVGLFSVIGSNNANDYAEVKNLIFTDVDIRTDFPDGFAAVGTLAGEVNGYANISGIVVVDGNLMVNPSGVCDTVGAGGIIGECRTADSSIMNNFISVTDCYNGADVFADGSRADLVYAAGIIGRVAQSGCKTISQCVNTGIVQYAGYDAFGIATAQNGNAGFLNTLTDCYIPSSLEQQILGGVTAVKDKNLLSGTLVGNLSADTWQAEVGCYPVPKFCLTSSAAGRIYLSGLSLVFAEEETASSVRTEIVLPQAAGGDAITWSSSEETALTIEGDKAVAHPTEIGMDTTVMLTARSDKGYSRSFKIVVLSDNAQVAAFDQPYAKVGTALTVSVSNLPEGTRLNYRWSVGGKAITNSGNSYTPTKNDLEKFISVAITTADGSVSWNLSTYCSELPVIYIDTNDGQGINSNTVAKDAVMKMQGNDEFNDPSYWYNGKTTIKGRGNSTWSQAVAWNVKKPYKLKLDKKANLYGLGKNNKKESKNTNKHWTLLANMIDHTNMRNELAYNFSRDIGMEVSMGTTNVVLILNGQYQGIYELAEHVRVGSARVNVHDWEGLADDIAEAICLQNPALKQSDLEDVMEQDYSWVTTKEVTFKGTTYKIADYYTEEIPEVTGGFLLDMDFRSKSDQYKYISTFSTRYGNIPMFFRSPEYAKTSDVMMAFAQGYLDAYEASLRSPDFTTEYNGENVHYTDLFDLDSLLQYWLLCEYVNNWDSMKNSTYLYKDIEGKAKMGPAWDYDWAWGNINMYSMTGPFVYDNWHTTLCGMDTFQGGFAEQGYQKEQWNRYLVKDPYFVTKAFEFYKKYRPTVIEDIMKNGGTIDTLQKKYSSASLANDDKWAYSYDRCSGYAFVNGQQVHTTSQTYDAAVESLKTFIEKRMQWMDAQFTDVQGLYRSLGNQVSSKISVTAKENSADGTVTATVKVTDANVNAVTFLVNGKKAEVSGSTVVPLTNGEASITVDDRLLEATEGAMNTIEVLGLRGNAYVTGAMNFTNIVTTNVEVPEVLTGTVTVTSSREGDVSYPGDTLTAKVSDDTNNTGTLSYQWYAGSTKITGATKSSYVLTESEIGKSISVRVASTVQTQTIQGKYKGTVNQDPEKLPQKLTGTVTVTSSREGDVSYPGDTLTANVGDDTNNTGTLNYQWFAGETAIAGATKSSYMLTESEIGKSVSVKVASTVETGQIQGEYAGTIVAEPGPGPGPDDPAELTGTVAVSSSRTGSVSYPGDVLTVKVAQDNNTGTLGYQWFANGVKITGATKATYVLTTQQIGKKLTVEVTSSVETGKISGTYAGRVAAKPIKATSISVSAKSKKMYAYQTLQLKATVKPQGASQNVSYTVDKKSVATVSKSGKVTAKSPGKVKITVKATDGSNVKTTYTVTVLKPVLKVSGKTTVKLKKSITLTAKPYGLKGTVKWKLDAKGKKLLKMNRSKGNKVKLTAKKNTGTAKLTITCGKKKVTKKIRVKK